jgi:Co/Zn/Cd efflux system component
VVALNAAMFAVEIGAGALAGSMALQADSLDFAADATTYGISLWAIGRSDAVRSNVALLKGISLALMAAWVLAATGWRVLTLDMPEPVTMSAVGLLAFAVNLGCALLLFRWRDGDANVRSVWLCTRNDAIGNVAVIAAASVVALTGTAWPDLIVAAGMGALFLSSSVRIVRQAWAERRTSAAAHRHEAEAAHPAKACAD